jgi:hypothetical protein
VIERRCTQVTPRSPIRRSRGAERHLAALPPAGGWDARGPLPAPWRPCARHVGAFWPWQRRPPVPSADDVPMKPPRAGGRLGRLVRAVDADYPQFPNGRGGHAWWHERSGSIRCRDGRRSCSPSNLRRIGFHRCVIRAQLHVASFRRKGCGITPLLERQGGREVRLREQPGGHLSSRVRRG